MPFEYQTKFLFSIQMVVWILNYHLNTRQGKVRYSYVRYSDPHCLSKYQHQPDHCHLRTWRRCCSPHGCDFVGQPPGRKIAHFNYENISFKSCLPANLIVILGHWSLQQYCLAGWMVNTTNFSVTRPLDAVVRRGNSLLHHASSVPLLPSFVHWDWKWELPFRCAITN